MIFIQPWKEALAEGGVGRRAETQKTDQSNIAGRQFIAAH